MINERYARTGIEETKMGNTESMPSLRPRPSKKLDVWPVLKMAKDQGMTTVGSWTCYPIPALGITKRKSKYAWLDLVFLPRWPILNYRTSQVMRLLPTESQTESTSRLHRKAQVIRLCCAAASGL
jgi:hypothetical protein